MSKFKVSYFCGEVKFEDNLTFTSKEQFATFDSSEKATRGFCKKCGTSLFDYYKPGNVYFVPPAIIENLPEEKIIFNKEIYYDNKPCYYAFLMKQRKS